MTAPTAARPADTPLRRAAAADRAALEAMQAAAWAANAAILGVVPAPLRWDYRAVLRDWEGWIAEDAGGFLGALLLNEEAADGDLPATLVIESIAVHPRGQGRGLGDRLLALGEARGRERGLPRARLVTGERLTANVAWYARRGYGVDRVEDAGDRRVVHMSRRLDDGRANGPAPERGAP